MRRALVGLGLCWVVTMVGCGGGGPVALKDVPAEFVDAVCSWQVRCHAQQSRTTCKSVTFADVGDEVGSVQAGRATYDSSLAGSCLDGIRDSACTVAGLLGSLTNRDCEAVFTGTVAVGGACVTDVDCAANGDCDHAPGCDSDVSCCPGTCTAGDPRNLPVGATCESSSACAEGLYCKRSTMAGGASSCAPLITIENALCDRREACAPPLTCTGSEISPMACKKLPGENEACDPALDVACNFIFDRCDPLTRLCVRRPTIGEACTSECLDNGDCVGGTCVARGLLNAGCGDNLPECSGDLECRNNVCVAPTPSPVCP